jgi:hypothetical protein
MASDGPLLALAFLIRELNRNNIDALPLLAQLQPSAGEVAVRENESFLQGTNMLHLLDIARNGEQARVYYAHLVSRIPRGILMRDRDCFDLSSKFIFALKALQVGLTTDDILVDSAQAGGLYGRADGLLRNPVGCFDPLELKGTTEKMSTPGTYNFKGVCVERVWEHLFLVGRSRQLLQKFDCWNDIAKLEPYVVVAYIHYDDFAKTIADGNFKVGAAVDVQITPGSTLSRFGGVARWAPGGLAGFTREWFAETVRFSG